MKYYCLFNPMAGNEKSAEKIKKLPEFFPDADVVRYDVTKTPYAEIFPLLEKDDKIILCGGDGTLNRFVNYYLKTTFIYSLPVRATTF